MKSPEPLGSSSSVKVTWNTARQNQWNGKENDPLRGCSPHPNYLGLLSKEISLLLLGPHVSHIVLVVFEAHLRGSSALTNSTSPKLIMHNRHINKHVRLQFCLCIQFNILPCTVQSSPRSCVRSWALFWIWPWHQQYYSTRPPRWGWPTEYPLCMGTADKHFH